MLGDVIGGLIGGGLTEKRRSQARARRCAAMHSRLPYDVPIKARLLVSGPKGRWRELMLEQRNGSVRLRPRRPRLGARFEASDWVPDGERAREHGDWFWLSPNARVVVGSSALGRFELATQDDTDLALVEELLRRSRA